MKPSIQVMLDLETFGVKEYSAIISIGAVVFDPTKQGEDAIAHEYHVTIDPETAQAKGLRLDASTVLWWMQPNQRAALDDWRNTIHFSLDVALDGFSQFLLESLREITTEGHADFDPAEQVTIWGNGPQFDCMLLRQAFEMCQRDVPWKHYNEKCFRTMKNLPGAKSLTPPIDGVKHNALVDARHQALWLCNILKMIPALGPVDIGKPMIAPPLSS